MKYKRMHINYFRKFHNCDFEFGKRITVISGLNGIGKSSLLSFIASTTGSKHNRLNGTEFQPDFFDLFNISPSEDYSSYRLYIEFDKILFTENKGEYPLTKRISFKNDTSEGRGIRIIPRTVAPIENNSNKVTNSDAQKASGSYDGRIHIPTIYASLSRLIPLGETKTTEAMIENDSNIIKNGYADYFAEIYNTVLPDSINPNNIVAYELTKNNRTYLTLKIRNTTSSTLSVGQDNLANLISAITDFYALQKESPNYSGGILCVDEIDSSLHPSAVMRIWKLLDEVSEKLDLQIILTSHSLIILKEIIKCQKRDPTNYKLVYFKNPDLPTVASIPSYDQLKADLFDEVTFSSPKINVYCEDKHTALLFNLLNVCATNLNKLNFSDLKSLHNIDISLGKDHLKDIVKKDSYFRKTIICLDGDARTKKPLKNDDALTNSQKSFQRNLKTSDPRSNNILFLPTFYPPEIYVYKIMKDYVTSPLKYQKFWTTIENDSELSLYTSDRVKRMFSLDKNIKFNDLHSSNDNKDDNKKKSVIDDKEKWFRDIVTFMDKSNILSDYYSQPDKLKELEEYVKHLKNALNAAQKANKSQLFS